MNNIVKLSDDGRALCGGCGATLECDKVSGDMPITCPICGGGLEYSAFKVNKDFEEFTLLIRNGNSDRGDYYHAFDSIEELVEAFELPAHVKGGSERCLAAADHFQPAQRQGRVR